jgi:hypothetical protein
MEEPRAAISKAQVATTKVYTWVVTKEEVNPSFPMVFSRVLPRPVTEKVQAVTKEEADPSSPPSASSQESANLLSPLP